MQYSQSLERLRNIMDELRERCPWDKKQTIHSLRPQTLEEVYELTDTIVNEDWKGLREELGDLLLHIVFYSKIGAEKQEFTLDDVIEGVCNKLVNRHPHIYSHVKVENEDDVKQNWERIKQQEGKKSILSGVPPSMPALLKALQLQEKTKKVGFEWENTGQVQAKVNEEMQELFEAVAGGNPKEMEDELGDVLFAIINYARFIKVDPERALEQTNKKFIRRFQRVEELAVEKGTTVHDMTLWEMDELWNQVKKEERS
ncbi:MAG: nucleoside triphosphate pyrophosphohydrolase [Taibaiella sp.]|nr:nucleoside triphosphate pyrophosphohydrolase [Taibaiella sp.]